MNIQRTQKLEKYLSIAQVAIAVAGPIVITFSMGKVHWFWKCHMILAIMVFVVWINYFRSKLSQKLNSHFNNLQAGAVLGSRIPKDTNRFVVTRCSGTHYHLKIIESGKQILVPKTRIQDDFEILH